MGENELPLLTLCVIARDEEAVISRCLDSVLTPEMRPWCGQIVVVDTGSTDRTVALAKERGAEVVFFPWRGDFAAARNAGLVQARGRYILVMDADEYLGAESLPAWPQILLSSAPEPGGAAIRRQQPLPGYRCLLQDLDEDGRRGMQARIVRLFPNLPHVRFAWPVHEQVETSLQAGGHPVRDAEIVIYHTGYRDGEQRRRKQQRNLAILLEQMRVARRQGREVHPMTLFFAGGACLDLQQPEEGLRYYQQCAAAVAPETDLGRAAVVRQASSYAAMQCWEAIEHLAEPGPVAQWHPELLVEKGKALLARGGETASRCRAWFEAALACAEKPRLPACDHGAMRAEALLGLANYWHRLGQNSALGVALLRAALRERQGGGQVTLEELRTLHLQHGACLTEDSVA